MDRQANQEEVRRALAIEAKNRSEREAKRFLAETIAGESKRVAAEKEALLRVAVEPYIAQGYRVEELELVEKRDPGLDPRKDLMFVGVARERSRLTLWLRRQWRIRVRVYVYAIGADREHSRVMDGPHA